MGAVETELLRAIDNAVSSDDYRNRQDYLAALIIEVSKLSDESFGNLTEETYVWCHQAAVARREKKPIQDFNGGMPDVGDAPPSEEVVPTDAEYHLNQGEPESYPEPEKPKKKQHRKIPPPMKGLTGEIDEYGIAVGTEAHKAAMLWARPEGATMAEVKAVLGDTKYNLKNRLKNQGYPVAESKETDRSGTVYRLSPKPKVDG